MPSPGVQTPGKQRPFWITLAGDLIRVPLPLPALIGCGHRKCRSRPRCGPWKGKDNLRLAELRSHMRNNHLGHTELREEFYCSSCYRVFASQHSGGRHAKACEQPPPTVEASELASLLTGNNISASSSDVTARSDMPSTQLCGKDLILLYPAAKNTVFCPICGITFRTEKTDAMNSVFRHSECTHKLERQITKRWRCSKCSWLGEGIAMVHHFKSCGGTSNDAQNVISSSTAQYASRLMSSSKKSAAAEGAIARAKAPRA